MYKSEASSSLCQLMDWVSSFISLAFYLVEVYVFLWLVFDMYPTLGPDISTMKLSSIWFSYSLILEICNW